MKSQKYTLTAKLLKFLCNFFRILNIIYVSDHMKLTGAVLFREDPQPKAKAPRKLEQIKSEPLKPHTDDKKVEILTEDSSKVEIVKESL